MSGNYVSTQYLANVLSLPTMQTKSELAIAETESSTGQYADLGLQLGAQSGQEISLKNENDLLQTLTSSNNIVSTNLSATQTSLDTLRTSALNTLQTLAEASGTTSLSAFQNLGENSLQSLIATTNTTSNGEYVFGGINNGVPPMSDYFSSPTSSAKTAVDQAFTTAFGISPSDPAASTISASDIQNFLSGPFAAQFQGASWSANWSSASSTNTSSDIAPGENIETSTNANQPGFQKLAEAYTMLSEFSGSSLSTAAQQTVASTASSLISEALSSLTTTEATVGSAQSRITDANNTMSSQMTILQTQIGGLDDVDSYATATKVSALTTQIQTSYELTAKLQQLSLSQYL
jgi:flagellar hook-associated protein 3 FlgL